MVKKAFDEFYVVTDFQNRSFRLYAHTIEHIRQSHPEIAEPLRFVEAILKDPILITEDELPNTLIYHQRAKKPLVHVAYAEVEKNIIKSAHISDKIKGGNVVWFAKTEDLLS